jgi:Uma2 family endonuclease
MTVAALPTRTQVSPPPKGFKNGVEWLHSLGDVSLERVVFNPWPGFATEEDFLQLNDGDEKRACELIDGTLVEKIVGHWESVIAIRIARALGNFIDGKNLAWITGEQGPARTSATRVRLPDVSLWLADQFPGRQIPSDAIPNTSPAFLVEVLSEGNTQAEMDQKNKEYFSSGTRLVWHVDRQKKTVAVFNQADKPTLVLREGEIVTAGEVLPGFAIRVDDIFKLSY